RHARKGAPPRALDLPPDLLRRRTRRRPGRARRTGAPGRVRIRSDSAARTHARAPEGGTARAARGDEGGPRARLPHDAGPAGRRTPALSATDPDGVRHDAFRISDYAAHVELQGLVKNAEAIIADGHHRYETALAFSKDPAAEKLSGARYKLCAIVDMASPGVIVRPIHRLI